MDTNHALCMQLLEAEDEATVETTLDKAGYLKQDAAWMPFGGFEMNISQISNQQADATPALVEKLINSIDAVLMGACYRAGVEPKSSQAPRSMTEAVETYFGIRDGRLDNLTAKEQTALAQRIHLVATGSRTDPCYLIVDSGEGQQPDDFKNTFLSLSQRNKDDIPFVQGRFNCGGTGVLPFCGKSNYQLIISRRDPGCSGHTTGKAWGFTIVRKLRPAAGRKSSMYVYLAPHGNILSFNADTGVPVLPAKAESNKPPEPYKTNLSHGTCIKLYNYRWKPKSNITLDPRFELERYLHSVCLPIRLTETRQSFKGHYFSTTLSGLASEWTEEGGQRDQKYETDFSPGFGVLNLPNIGRLPYRIYLLKEDYKSRKKSFPHGVFFTLNGQVHGELAANFISTSLKYDCLSEYLLVSVDCTEMNPEVREDFMMASRDRVRRNEVYHEIVDTIKEELKEHPGLRLSA